MDRARLAGAAMALLIGPAFPNLGLPFVVALAVWLLAYGAFFRRRAERASSEREARRLAWASFAGDATAVGYAMLVFSPDPLWTTFVLGSLVVIIGGSRLGNAGTAAAVGSMSAAYLAVALFRDRALGLDLEPQRLAFHIGFFVLTGLLVAGILRELRTLRGEREDTIRIEADASQVHGTEARLRSVLDSALDAVVGMDADGRIVEWNPQARALFGWSREEAVGRVLAETIVPERYRADHRRGLERYRATGEGPVLRRRIELEALRRDGTELPVELSIVPIDSGDGVTFSAFVRDLTQRRHAEAAARREIALEQAAQARSALLMKASHELRTPLNAILGFAELLREQLGATLSERQRRYLDNIHEAGTHLLALVTDLLELSRIEAERMELELEELTLAEIVSAMVAAAQPAAARGDVALDIAGMADATVLADRARLGQALLALISLAIERSPAGARVAVSARLDGGSAALAIADRGPALDPAALARLFDVLEPRAEGGQGGGGFGLELAKRLVELHGGRIEVASAADGTTLRVHLPTTAGRAGAPR